MAVFKSILITGAAGDIGSVIREAVRPHCSVLRCSDLREIDVKSDHEQSFAFDLRDMNAAVKATEGVDLIFHFGGIPLENTWDNIRSVNIDGTYNIYEAARLNGVKRVVYASSNHAMGFYRRSTTVGQAEAPRADSRYGVSKVAGEAIARLYADKHGIETISLRIGQYRPKPTNRRMLSLWLSPADMGRLAVACLTPEQLHFEVVYGVSANSGVWYDNPGARRIGFDPKDSADEYSRALPPEALLENEVEAEFQGGPFCSAEFDGSLAEID